MNFNQTISDRLEQEIREGLLDALNKPVTRETIRETLAARRQERLTERYSELAKAERFFMDVVDVPVNWDEVQPVMKWVETQREREIWDYARNVVSSMPESGYVGRQSRLYFEDEKTNRLLGILLIGSSLQTNKMRDEHIGWRQEEKYKKLIHIVNLAVCVPIQPFGTLCGGKLLFVAALSNESRIKYEHEYGDSLLAVETTSLFGKSSQYNRVKEYSFLGLTSGYGNVHISETVWKKIIIYLKIKNVDATQGGGQARFRSRVIDQVSKMLSIKANISHHGQGRGYYWGVTAENSEAILKGENGVAPKYYDRPLTELTKFWRKRWYEMRLPKKREEVESFDPSVYLLDNNVAPENRGARQAWLF